jgi:sulfatase modifying factor 1
MRIMIPSIICLSVMACQHTVQQTTPPPNNLHNVCYPNGCPNPPPPANSVKIEGTFTVVPEPTYCPNGMVHVVGDYCPKVEQKCLEWMSKEEADKPWARCKRYQQPSVCLSKQRVHMDYCIDREELHDEMGMPYDLTWGEAQKMCTDRGAKLCDEDQWNMACEGEDMAPYPYGSGFEFSNTTCNTERQPIMCGNKACDYRANITEFPGCTSLQYHVHQMVGDTDDWIEVPQYAHSSVPGLMLRSGLKGGTMFGGRHRCRPITKNHGAGYHNFTDGRCCQVSSQ